MISGVFIGCSDDTDDPIPVTDLNVAVVTTAPANATDAAWDEADALELSLGDDAAYSSIANVLTDLTLKAVRTSSTLYILAEWMDNSGTENVDKNQWTYSAADGWTKSGNEDRIFFMFDAGDNGTEGADCATMCHVADGIMSTTGGGHVDVWHGKGARTFPVGTVDDKWWDENGRGSDSKTVGAYSDNIQTLADGSTVPMYSGPITDGHYIINSSTVTLVEFDTTATSGVIPGYILNEDRDGSRFDDVSADASYSGGKWTVMFSRALDTAHDDDVAFTTVADDQVQMTVAVTDNSGGSHVGAAPFYIIF
ncbi:MAG: hypothetical protein HQ509_05125 [Candidatus Marinimicrobia bacterium]|nr:hypothetical protein [Candidatus Neomarinimicrobiota bacterium]